MARVRNQTVQNKLKKRREIAACAIFIVILSSITLLLSALAIDCFDADVDGSKGVARIFRLLFIDKILVQIFAGTVLIAAYAILFAGKSVIADSVQWPWLFYGACGSTVLALLSLMWIGLSLNDANVMAGFVVGSCDPTRDCTGEMMSGVLRVFGGLGAWLIGCLVTLLGLSKNLDPTGRAGDANQA